MYLRKSLFSNPRLLLCSPIFLLSVPLQFVCYRRSFLLDFISAGQFVLLVLLCSGPFIMGAFYVTEHFILLDVVIGFSVGPIVREFMCISPIENGLKAPTMSMYC
jgi:hypothetical protein